MNLKWNRPIKPAVYRPICVNWTKWPPGYVQTKCKKANKQNQTKQSQNRKEKRKMLNGNKISTRINYNEREGGEGEEGERRAEERRSRIQVLKKKRANTCCIGNLQGLLPLTLIRTSKHMRYRISMWKLISSVIKSWLTGQAESNSPTHLCWHLFMRLVHAVHFVWFIPIPIPIPIRIQNAIRLMALS